MSALVQREIEREDLRRRDYVHLISVRPYVRADAQVTLTLFQRAIREVANRDYDAAHVEAWARVDSLEAWADRRASRPTWVAEVGGVPAGFTDLEINGHLDMMFVSPDFQGIGVASSLLSTAEAAASQLALLRIFTEASLTARPFFARRGFSLLGFQRIEEAGQSYVLANMEKPIGRQMLRQQ